MTPLSLSLLLLLLLLARPSSPTPEFEGPLDSYPEGVVHNDDPHYVEGMRLAGEWRKFRAPVVS
jgi:hypothetical protein